MSAAAKEIINMSGILPESDQNLAVEIIRKSISAGVGSGLHESHTCGASRVR